MELKHLDTKQREILAKKFIEEVILPTWKQLSTWNKLTNQTSQLDFGYLAQHLVSIITGIPGTRGRGKGLDLEDGSEVKSASCVDAVDTPRWNAINGTSDTVAAMKIRLDSTPAFYFVLLDTTERGGSILRCRMWCVRPSEDIAFREVLTSWAGKVENGEISKKKSRPNLQLHPPRWEQAEKNITTNECGNLKMPLVYEAIQLDVPGILVMETKLFQPELMKSGLSEPVEKEKGLFKKVGIATAVAVVGTAVAMVVNNVEKNKK